MGDIFMNDSLERFNESKVEFVLHVHTDTEDEVDLLIVIAYSNHTMRSMKVNASVSIEGQDEMDVEYRYLTDKILTCNVYNIRNLVELNATLNFTIFENLNISITQSRHEDVEPICLYFDETRWTWSDEGMMTTYTSQDQVSCYSDHITSFTVLLKVTKIEQEGTQIPKTSETVKDALPVPEVLSLLSQVFLSLSLIFLLVSLIIYCSFLELWRSLRNSIHKNLVINMILMQSLFIFGIEKNEHKSMCTVVSVLLHLTSLNTFTWMCGEAVYLFFQVSTSASSRFNRLRHFMAFCYGIPLVIVVISTVGFASKYNVDDVCWLNKDTGTIWTFVTPAIYVVMLTIAIMCVVFEKVYNRPSSGKWAESSTREQDKFQQLKYAACGTVLLLPIMGTTWIIGPFAYSSDDTFVEHRDVVNVLNAFQGILVFFIYCVFDYETKACFQARFSKKKVGLAPVVK
ncbi:adhesion G protein-coupled receptor L4-like [Anneissia japonica]|uniref:adhesion G protein-coupled receptor L4-like n=1 Tax=Anneissia japonica TaxID=1529436 RepID=UPI00142560A3|nr:adhesion G protein-coupled receptor L4-like [Anneissia japonica]